MADEREGGPWTRHGHPVDGVTRYGSNRPPIARCGGPGLCRKCAVDAEQIRAGAARETTPGGDHAG